MTGRDQSHAAISREEIDRLATYNTEVYRGLVHTKEYDAEMACLQRIFTRAKMAEAKAKGWTIIGGES